MTSYKQKYCQKSELMLYRYQKNHQWKSSPVIGYSYSFANMDLVNSLNVKTTLFHIIAKNGQGTSHGDSNLLMGCDVG